MDAPAFRIWPPVALGVPLLAGYAITEWFGDPLAVPDNVARIAGLALLGGVAIWNGWALLVMARHRTALLPGGATRVLIDTGPFGMSRNPLYVGLTALDVGLALLWPSFWALLLVPIGFVLLWWGAVRPEESYLASKFGEEYAGYRARVRRWL